MHPISPNSRPAGRWLGVAALAVALGCDPAGPGSRAPAGGSAAAEGPERSGVDAFDAGPGGSAPAGEAAPEVALDGHLASYRAHALASRPSLQASHARWRASTHGPAAARRLPELVVSYGGFIRAVETRVGPQQHRLGVLQWLPWPTTITRARDAASRVAEAERAAFEAELLAVGAEVDRAYWDLWLLRAERSVLEDERGAVEALRAQVDAGLEVGRGDLGDVARLSLLSARLDDRLEGLDLRERSARAELLRVVGAGEELSAQLDAHPLPTLDDPPGPVVPAEDGAALVRRAVAHPQVTRLAALAEAEQARAEAARARQAPSLGLGVDWIVVGRGDATGPDAGQDAVIAMASIKVPLSFGASRAEVAAARAMGEARRADARAQEQQLAAGVHAALARVEDGARRVSLHEDTLIPRATTAFDAVIASYVAGRSGVADLVLAEQAVIELGLSQLQARRDHAVAWAELQALVGGTVEARA